MDRSNDVRGLERRKGCDFCLEKKYKCDTRKPKCSNCVFHMVSCVWTPSILSVREVSSDRVTGIERRLKALEEQIRRTTPVDPIAAGSTQLIKVEPYEEVITSNRADPFTLPPYEQVKAYVDDYFGIFNTGMPLFDEFEFKLMVERWYNMPEERTHDNWAAINVVIALAIRYTFWERTQDYCKGTEFSCIANVQSAVSKFVCQKPLFLNLRTTLGLILVLMAGPVPRSASHLMGLAVKMVHGMTLHIPLPHSFPSVERHNRERLFWIAYIIDRDLSLIASEPYLLQDHDIGYDLKEMTCSLGGGNVQTYLNLEREILQPRAELAKIQGKLYDLVNSVRASKFSYSQKVAAQERLYRTLDEWHKGLEEPDFKPDLLGEIPVGIERKSCQLHETLLHLAYYRCLYSVACLSVRNVRWLQQLKEFSDKFIHGKDTRILTSASPLLPLNWRHLADSARWCNELVLNQTTIYNPALRWISAPVSESTATILAAHLIALPERDLDETLPCSGEPEYQEIENDESRMEDARSHYRQSLYGAEDCEVLANLGSCEELVSEAERSMERFFDIAPIEFWDARNGGFTKGIDEEVYLRS
ncbi:hypothetical protein FPOAC2_11669 [Fusarium poae]|uniref:Zn(2)-C6 fungal-type domain-containing protein n=1 Tax=Fusarium poae TaxID=36050 RepID=A0A1B8AEB4_FUSPO|nr:hypothetical protein FPOA_10537 [Fusarium poae]